MLKSLLLMESAKMYMITKDIRHVVSKSQSLFHQEITAVYNNTSRCNSLCSATAKCQQLASLQNLHCNGNTCSLHYMQPAHTATLQFNTSSVKTVSSLMHQGIF